MLAEWIGTHRSDPKEDSVTTGGILNGKVAVVTGGSRGIGAGVADSLQRAGAGVAVLDLRLEPESAPGGVAISCDVSQEASVMDAFTAIDARLGPVDILVNGAGLAIRSPAIDMKVDDFNVVLGVNLTGAFVCSREAARRMAGRGGGAIVNIASVMGLSGGLFPNAAYQASKGGLVNLTRALAVEWAALGIRVNAVAPTYVETDLTRALLARPEALDRVLGATPMRRLATIEEVAAAVLFLAGPESGMTTGHTLAVDGGFLAV